MKVFIPSTKFKKSLKKLDDKIKVAFKKRFLIFEKNEFDQVLNNHRLSGKYKDCQSINVTGDFRLIYKKKTDNVYLLVDIDTHSNLYG